RTPHFDYRPLVVDGDLVKRRLYELPIERLEDPTLATLFGDTRDELARKITMLEDRNTPNFLYGSLAVFGSVDAPLLELARLLLDRLPGSTEEVAEGGDDRAQDEDERVDAEGFAARATLELEGYRQANPELSSRAG